MLDRSLYGKQADSSVVGVNRIFQDSTQCTEVSMVPEHAFIWPYFENELIYAPNNSSPPALNSSVVGQ